MKKDVQGSKVFKIENKIHGGSNFVKKWIGKRNNFFSNATIFVKKVNW